MNHVIEHGAQWYNNGKRIACPECFTIDVEPEVIPLGSSRKEGNSVLEGPGVFCFCRGCGCRFFVERDTNEPK